MAHGAPAALVGVHCAGLLPVAWPLVRSSGWLAVLRTPQNALQPANTRVPSTKIAPPHLKGNKQKTSHNGGCSYQNLKLVRYRLLARTVTHLFTLRPLLFDCCSRETEGKQRSPLWGLSHFETSSFTGKKWFHCVQPRPWDDPSCTFAR